MSRMETTPQDVIRRAKELRGKLGDFHDQYVESVYVEAANIAEQVVSREGQRRFDFDAALDKVLTSRMWGFPIMVLMLGVVLWITLTGANIPSQWLATLLPLLMGFVVTFGVTQGARLLGLA